MHVYLYNTNLSDALKMKFESLGCKLVKSIEQATCVVYSDDISELFENENLHENLRVLISEDEVLRKANPLLPEAGDISGRVEAKITSETLSEVTAIVDGAIASTILEDSFKDLSRYLKLVSIELIQNALIYKKESARSEEIVFEMLRGDKYYQVEVFDRFGALSIKTFLEKITRAFREKTHENKKNGAGLGFSMIVAASDELEITIKVGEFTRIRSIINKHKRLKEYKKRKPSVFLG